MKVLTLETYQSFPVCGFLYKSGAQGRMPRKHSHRKGTRQKKIKGKNK